MADSSDEELPLSALEKWLPDAETMDWIRLKEADYEEPPYFDPFQQQEEETKPTRVRTWTSSKTNLDGIGGFDPRHEDSEKDPPEDHGVQVIYIISEKNWEGFGDTVWASSRFLANQLADPDACRKLIPLLSNDDNDANHPLHGVSFVELGAGAGIPSWTAMQCGARVVSTDQAVPDRIRCMAESIERNSKITPNNQHAKACPHDWGKDCALVLKSLNESGSERFKVVAAADCCYMPWLHTQLLESIDNLMDKEDGVALITFALHGNTDDESVWGIVDLAKEKGCFKVEILESHQLTPPKAGMGQKQGLVHSIRLSRL